MIILWMTEYFLLKEPIVKIQYGEDGYYKIPQPQNICVKLDNLRTQEEASVLIRYLRSWDIEGLQARTGIENNYSYSVFIYDDDAVNFLISPKYQEQIITYFPSVIFRDDDISADHCYDK